MVLSRTIITKSAPETQKVGEELANHLKTHHDRGKVGSARVICLYGELGSGKTTLAQGFARGLGINQRLPSPTFIIVRRYDLRPSGNFFYHIDLYRLAKSSEIAGLGLNEILADSGSFVAIEWAEKLGELLPKDRIDIRFKLLGDHQRTISLNKTKL